MIRTHNIIFIRIKYEMLHWNVIEILNQIILVADTSATESKTLTEEHTIFDNTTTNFTKSGNEACCWLPWQCDRVWCPVHQFKIQFIADYLLIYDIRYRTNSWKKYKRNDIEIISNVKFCCRKFVIDALQPMHLALKIQRTLVKCDLQIMWSP